MPKAAKKRRPLQSSSTNADEAALQTSLIGVKKKKKALKRSMTGDEFYGGKVPIITLVKPGASTDNSELLFEDGKLSVEVAVRRLYGDQARMSLG